ncbi:MBG domain-containing protein, partial [Sunxiuqinia sp. sy24]|uniref:MBG domain-containing protein n=1 Tax=Sunxiuqinia sp. sy24 TaxID=3461495 RepID=UPI0040461D90
MKHLLPIFILISMLAPVKLVNAQFSGDFAPANWTLYRVSTSSNANVDTLGAPSSIVFEGNDSDAGDMALDGLYDEYSITIPASYSGNSISFDWDFTNLDVDNLEEFSYVVNGAETLITSITSIGSSTVPVAPGDVFAFRIFTGDDCCGRGTLTVSNFSWTPIFNNGASATLTVDENSAATSINDLLAITDTDTGDPLTWSVTTVPTHGSLSGFNATGTSTGSSVTPTGLTYTPTTDYSGSDSFVIQISDETATAEITVNVTVKASQTITFDAITDKTYGEADFTLGDATTDKGLPVTYTAANPSIVSINGNNAIILKAGNTTITASQDGDATRAAATPIQQTLVVTPKELTVTNAVAASKVYDGNTDAVISGATLSGILGSDDVTLGNTATGNFAQAEAGTNIAVTTSMTISGTDAENYTLTQPALTADITQKALTITADDKTKTYDGEVYSPLTVSYSGFVTGEDETVLSGSLSFSGTATTTIDVGKEYLIAPGGLTSSNYDITFVNGTLEIYPKSLIVTADDQSKAYDGAVFSPFTVSYSGFVTGEDEDDLGGIPTFSGTATSAIDIGEDYTIIPGGLSSWNYSIYYIEGKLDITKKELNVLNAMVASKVYDGNTDAVISGATLSGVAEGDDVTLGNITTGTFAQAEAGMNIAVGTSMTISGADAGKYTLIQPTLTADITQKELTITADDKTKTYDGTGYSPFTVSYSGFITGEDENDLEGTLAFNGTATTNSNVGENYVITPGGLSSLNYNITFVDGHLDIAQMALTVTADAGQTKVYGEADPTFTYAVAPALVGGDSFSGELTRAAGEDVDLYAITQGTLTAGSNYDLNFVSNDFSITQKAITVTADAGQTKVYGEADPVFTYTFAPALISGDSFSGELSREAGEDVDLYAITQGTLTAGSNYDLNFVSNDFSITQKAITVTADAGQTKIYGEADPVFTYAVAPALVAGDSFSGELSRAAGEDVDLYAITQGTLTAGSNYDLSFVSNDFSITQKAITVTADAGQTKVYGEADPIFTYAVTPALVAGDSFSGELTRVAGEDVDLYAITQGTLTAGANYDLSFVSNDFSITQKAITVTADAGQTKIYGEADPVFTYAVAPALVGGDSFSGELTRAAGEDVDLYAITQGTLTAGSNYDLNFVSNDFSITQKAITVMADAGQTKIYGEADPVFTYAVAPALVAGDSFSGELSRTAGEDVDLYAITQGTLTAGSNYDLSFVSSDFSITQKAITVAANAGQTKIYGEADPAFTYTYTPALVGGDRFSGELSRTAGEDVDLYTITQGALTAGANYDLSFVSNDFS